VNSDSPLLLRYTCPNCSRSFETREFTNEYPARWFLKGAGTRFACPHCNAALKLRARFYLYFHLFVLHFCLVVATGIVASFIVEEKMHVTFSMLGAMLLCIPLIVLAAANNKAERSDESTHN